ncbi:hypothetical protein PR003_g610 [Phytophthora rubi]|nr:hypothetical protein PR003_g610 [Phytophthora rubi]
MAKSGGSGDASDDAKAAGASGTTRDTTRVLSGRVTPTRARGGSVSTGTATCPLAARLRPRFRGALALATTGSAAAGAGDPTPDAAGTDGPAPVTAGAGEPISESTSPLRWQSQEPAMGPTEKTRSAHVQERREACARRRT